MKQFAYMLLAGLLLTACQEKPIQTYPIEKGTFTQSFVETGELAAINTWSYVMPRFGRYWYEMKVIGLLEHGAEVQTGDSIIQLDPTEVNKMILDLEQNLETEEANLEKMLVNQTNSLQEMENTLKNEEANFALRKLSMESSRFESERIRKIRDLEFKQAQIQYDNTKQRIKANKIIAENDLKIQQIRVRQIYDDISTAKAVIPQLTVRTPLSGIFQIARNRRNRTLLKVGDEVYRGNNVGNVPDLTWMRVDTYVDETDIFKIKEGQRVNVRLDAIPNLVFPAEINQIGKLCHPREDNKKQKVFDVELHILVSDNRLKPGMTVSSEFLCESLNDVLFVPLNCVENTASGSYIYVKKGLTYERTEVETGPMNNTQIVIKGNVEPGQLVAPVNQVEKSEKESKESA